MNIIITAQMRKGTFEAKLNPLSLVEKIDNIYVVRKSPGPEIDKVKYIIIPKLVQFPLFKFLIPFIIARHAKNNNCSLILSYHYIPHAAYAYIASKLSGIPYQFSQTGGKIHQLFKKPIFRFFNYRVLKNSLFINTPGYQSLEQWVNMGIPESKIHVLHSTIDIDAFKDQEQTKEYDIIFVGRLCERKRVDVILNSIAKIKEKGSVINKVAIVGKGPLENEYKSLVEKLKIADIIDFVGFQNDINYWLNKSRVFIMFSHTEGLPVALMEAMATAKIVVVPAVDNIPTAVINNETGYLVDPFDFDQLENALASALELNDKNNKMKSNARKKIEKDHSYPSAINQWEKIFTKYEIN